MAEPKSFPALERCITGIMDGFGYTVDDEIRKATRALVQQARAERDAARELLAAAVKAEKWIADVTDIDDGVAYVNGKYDGFVDIVQQQLRAAITACQPGKELAK